MKILKKMSVLLLFAAASLGAFAGEWNAAEGDVVVEKQQNIMTIDVYINNVSKVQLQDIPTSGYLEVYSILGIKVTSINLKGVTENCTLDLPKGLYILKAGRVAKKIIVR